MRGVPSPTARETPDSIGSKGPIVIGRYAIYNAIAAGGMATVHLGRLLGEVGFQRTVAVKRLHAEFAHDAEFCSMFLDEARLVSRIQHPNVVPTLDVVVADEEVLLVMEYVRGESLSRLLRAAAEIGERCPPPIALAILSQALEGLHAAHEAVDEQGRPLALVHRDISPQNILVGTEGITRVLDFGVAKAAGRVHSTRSGQIKGKLLYMSPQQLGAKPVDRTTDVYAMGLVMFELLTSTKMFGGDDDHVALTRIVNNEIRVPSEFDPALEPFDMIVRRATALAPEDRYPRAQAMIRALARCGTPAPAATVSAWVQRLAGARLAARAKLVAAIEQATTEGGVPSLRPIDLRRTTSPSGVNSVPPSAAPYQDIHTGVSTKAALTLSSSVAPSLAPQSKRGWFRRSIFPVLLVLVTVAVTIAALPFVPHLPGRGDGLPSIPPATAVVPPVETATTEPSPPPTATATAAERTPPSTTATTAKAAPTKEPATKEAGAKQPSAKPIAPSAHVGSAPARAPAAAKPDMDCDPPWTVDPNGHRHFIPECVK